MSPGTEEERPVLVASGLGDDTGGGIYALQAGEAETIDQLSTTGIAVAGDGTTFARLLWTDDDPQTSGELLLYDARGVIGYRRVDALQEPHGIAWHRGQFVVVSTLANSILWLDASGALLRAWEAPGDGDCWHINNLVVWRDRLVASAFGRFDSHRGWTRPGVREGSGIVFDVETGEDIAVGLTCPHDPLPFEDGWLVCNSGQQELLRLAHDGRVTQRVPLGGWTRGLTCDDARVYVGVSAHRMLGAEGRAKVVALDRATLREVGSWALPCREVFSLAFVPASLVDGLRTGFATNPARLREGVGIDDVTLAMGRLGEAARQVRVTVADGPSSVRAGSWLTLRYALRNGAATTLVSAGDYPVLVGGRWFRDGVAVPDAVGRARLPSPVGPGRSTAGVLRLPTPAEPGSYSLRVTAGQDNVGWFDDGCEPWEVTIDVMRGS